jgi:catechol 2,3-dioxygenase-like lactoylglutathione lyase family enzyme
MIGYITLGTNNLQRAATFYDELLGGLGAKRLMTTEKSVHWSGVGTGLGVTLPFDGGKATAGNGTMVAFATAGIDQVNRLHKQALALGAHDEGEPGQRFPGFYAAYCRDLDGNKLAFFFMGQG